MKYTKSDLIHAENLIKIIKRGQYQFSGMESMAFTEACQWFNGIVESIQKEFATPKAPVQADLAINPVKEAVKPPVKPVKESKSKAGKKKKK